MKKVLSLLVATIVALSAFVNSKVPKIQFRQILGMGLTYHF